MIAIQKANRTLTERDCLIEFSNHLADYMHLQVLGSGKATCRSILWFRPVNIIISPRRIIFKLRRPIRG